MVFQRVFQFHGKRTGAGWRREEGASQAFGRIGYIGCISFLRLPDTEGPTFFDPAALSSLRKMLYRFSRSRKNREQGVG